MFDLHVQVNPSAVSELFIASIFAQVILHGACFLVVLPDAWKTAQRRGLVLLWPIFWALF